jgi:transposase
MEGDLRIDLYESGHSLSQIAAITNYSKSGVYYWLKANEIEMRSPGHSREVTTEDESK